MENALAGLVERVQAARASRTALDIRGGNTKAFYGEPPRGEPLDGSKHDYTLTFPAGQLPPGAEPTMMTAVAP